MSLNTSNTKTHPGDQTENLTSVQVSTVATVPTTNTRTKEPSKNKPQVPVQEQEKEQAKIRVDEPKEHAVDVAASQSARLFSDIASKNNSFVASSLSKNAPSARIDR